MLPLVNLHLCANKTQNAEMISLNNTEMKRVGSRTSVLDKDTFTLQSESSCEYPVGAQVGSDISLGTNKELSPGITLKTSVKGSSHPKITETTLKKGGRTIESNVSNGIPVGNKDGSGPKNQDINQVQDSVGKGLAPTTEDRLNTKWEQGPASDGVGLNQTPFANILETTQTTQGKSGHQSCQGKDNSLRGVVTGIILPTKSQDELVTAVIIAKCFPFWCLAAQGLGIIIKEIILKDSKWRC